MVRSVSSGMTAAELEQARQFRKTALKGANGASSAHVSLLLYPFTHTSIRDRPDSYRTHLSGSRPRAANRLPKLK